MEWPVKKRKRKTILEVLVSNESQFVSGDERLRLMKNFARYIATHTQNAASK
jgi:hypothetical protein